MTVVDPLVDFVADGFGEAGDFAVAFVTGGDADDILDFGFWIWGEEGALVAVRSGFIRFLRFLVKKLVGFGRIQSDTGDFAAKERKGRRGDKAKAKRWMAKK